MISTGLVIAGFGKRPSFKGFFSQSKEAGRFKKWPAGDFGAAGAYGADGEGEVEREKGIGKSARGTN